MIALMVLGTNIFTAFLVYHSYRKGLIEMGIYPVYRAFIRGKAKNIQLNAEVEINYEQTFNRDMARYGRDCNCETCKSERGR